MSHKNTALNQIKRYGFKGAAILNVKVKVSNKAQKSKTTIIDNAKPLLAYVGAYFDSKLVDTSVSVNTYRIKAALDGDFNGEIGTDDSITIDGRELAIISHTKHRINETIAYVEIIVNG